MRAVGLAPVAVDICRRRRGIVRTLIEAGFAELHAIRTIIPGWASMLWPR